MTWYKVLDLIIMFCMGYLGARTAQYFIDRRVAKCREEDANRSTASYMEVVDIELHIEDIILKSKQLNSIRPLVLRQKALYTGDTCSNCRMYLKQIEEILIKD